MPQRKLDENSCQFFVEYHYTAVARNKIQAVPTLYLPRLENGKNKFLAILPLYKISYFHANGFESGYLKITGYIDV